MRAVNPHKNDDLKKSKAQLIEELELWRSGRMNPALPAMEMPMDFPSAQLGAILRVADDAIISMDGQHRIRLFNDGAVNIFGFTTDEVIGQSINMLLPVDVRNIHRQHVDNFERSRKPARLMAQRAEVFGLRKNGEKFPAEASISKTRVGDEYFFTVILRDVSERKRAEEELRASQRLLKIVVDSVPHTIVVKDRESRYTLVNKSWCEFYGLHSSQVINTHSLEIDGRPQADKAQVYKEDQEVLAGDGRTMVFEHTRINSQGKTRYLQNIRTPIKNEKGEIEGLVAIALDITESKRAEDALKESEGRFRGLIDTSLLGVYIHTKHRFLYANQAFAQIYGYDSVEEILKVGDTRKFYAPHDRERMEGYYRARISGGTPPSRYEFQGVRKDGSLIWLENLVQIIDWQGRKAVLATLIDITERKEAEQALRESEERFRSVIDYSPSSIFLKDLDGRYTLVNRVLAERHGCSVEDLIGKTSEDLYPKEFAEGVVAQDRAVLETGNVLEWEHQTLYPDGTIRTLMNTKFPVRNNEGRITSVGTISTDITERKQAEEELRTSQRLLQTVFDAVPAGISVRDREGRYMMVNSSMAERYGLPAEKIVGRMANELGLPAELDEEFKRNILAVTESGKTIVSEELFVKLPNEEGAWRHMVRAPLRDEQGEVIGVVGVGIDITERKRAEEELKAIEARFRSVLEHSPSSIFLKDLEGRFTLATRVIIDQPNCAVEEMIGKTSHDVFPKDLADQFADHEKEVLDTGETVEREYNRTASDGSLIFVLNTKFPVRNDEGQTIGVGTIATDITERKRAEDSLRESEERFRSVMDHSPSAIHLKDLDGRFTLINRVFAERRGMPAEDIIGKTTSDFYSVDVSKQIGAHEREVLKTGGVVEREYDISFNDGSQRTTLSTKFPVMDAAGRIAGIATIATDITERKRHEETLRESQTLLQTVFDTIPHAVFVKGRDRRFVMANTALADMFGRKPEELVGLRGEDISSSPAEDQQVIFDTDRQVLDEGIAVDVPESRVTLADGRTRMRRLIKLPLKDDAGNVTGLVGLSEDITERKQIEEALKASEVRFRSIIDHSPSSIFMKDMEGRYTLVNRKLAERVGRTPDELIGRTAHEFFPKDMADQFAAHEKEVLQTGDATEREHENTASDGAAYIISSTKFPVLDNEGRIAGIATITTDITERKQIEEALKASEGRFRSIIDNSPSSIFLKDLEGRYTLVNRVTAEIAGLSQDELIGKSTHDLFSENVADQIAAHEKEVLDTGQVVERVHEFVSSDGSNQIMSSTKFPVLDNAGRTIGVGTIATEITKRRQAEQALKASEERFRNVLDHSPSPIHLKDLDGRYTLVNRATTEQRDLSAEKIIGSTDADFFPADYAKRVAAHEKEVVESRSVVEREDDFLTDDTSPRFFLITKFPVMDAEGHITNVGTITTDLTERKQAEEALREREALLQTVLDALAASVFVKDAQYRYIMVNNAMADQFGFTAEEFQNLATAKLPIPKKARDDFIDQDRRVMENGERIDIKSWPMKSMDGKISYWDISKLPLYDSEGNITGLVGVLMDVTEARELEDRLRESQKMEAVGQLAGGIAHEFNNMLQVVINSAQFLRKEFAESGKQQNLVDIILRASDRSATLTRQLLAFSRKSVMQPERLELDKLVSRAMNMLSRVIGEKFRIEFQTVENLWPVKADPGMMEQVLLNLCINARDAMPDGGKILIEAENVLADADYCTAHNLEQPGRYAVISVRDEGVGMSPEVLGKIFEPFFTTKEVGQGTGLGLAMVQGAVQQHHGAIEVSSELGVGTTFTIFLPVADAQTPLVEQPASADPEGGTELILLAEDEEDVLSILSRSLESKGYETLAANDGMKALSVFKENAERIGLVILDMVMPEMNGRQVYQEIRALGSNVPILFSSGYAPDEDDFAFLKKNGIPIIQKPYTLNDLFSAVRQALEQE